MPYLGWVDKELCWQLPVHQPVEACDFNLNGWRETTAACDVCLSPLLCGVCSYDPSTGLPDAPVAWPCMAVRGCQTEGVPSPRTPVEDSGKYQPRPRRFGPPSAAEIQKILGRRSK